MIDMHPYRELLRYIFPTSVVRNILDHMCIPGMLRALDLGRACNLPRSVVYAVVVENRKTWGILNTIVDCETHTLECID